MKAATVKKKTTSRKTRLKPEPESQPERDTYVMASDRPAFVCPFCQSANRTEYQKVRTIQGPVAVSGIVCDQVILRRTSCSDCGRKRIDRELFPVGSVRPAVRQN